MTSRIAFAIHGVFRVQGKGRFAVCEDMNVLDYWEDDDFHRPGPIYPMRRDINSALCDMEYHVSSIKLQF